MEVLKVLKLWQLITGTLFVPFNLSVWDHLSPCPISIFLPSFYCNLGITEHVNIGDWFLHHFLLQMQDLKYMMFLCIECDVLRIRLKDACRLSIQHWWQKKHKYLKTRS